MAMYRDERISGWRNNFIYKLPSGEIVAIYSDETERKKYEQKLQRSEKRFRELAENLPEVFWVVSPDWNQLHYISPAYEEVWGKSVNSLYDNPRSWMDAILPEDRELLTQYLNEKIGGDLSEITFPEYRIIRPDGSIRWILASGFPVAEENGKVDRIVGIAKDITKQKQSEKAFHAILESTVGIIGQVFFDKMVQEICDWLDCEIAVINEIDESEICTPVSMIVDSTPSEGFSCPLEGTPCQEVVLNGFSYYAEGISDRFPNVPYLSDLGAVGYVGTSLINENDHTIGVLSAISRKKLSLPERAEEVMRILAARIVAEFERKKSELEKIHIEAQLQQAQKMEAIGTLAGGIAHDFNNILQSIVLNTELALYERSSTEGLNRLDEILKASRRATDLVTQILTFSRQNK